MRVLFPVLAVISDSPLSVSSISGAPRRVVIVVPGMRGNQLREGGTVLWKKTDSLRNSRNSGLVAPRHAIQPCGFIEHIQILDPLVQMRLYGGLIAALRSEGYAWEREFIRDHLPTAAAFEKRPNS